jgi:hypothetical protein
MTIQRARLKGHCDIGNEIRTYRPVPADRVLVSHSLNRTLRYVTGRVRTSRLNVYWGEMLHKKDADCWARRRQIE